VNPFLSTKETDRKAKLFSFYQDAIWDARIESIPFAKEINYKFVK
jgi:hypothetical protein